MVDNPMAFDLPNHQFDKTSDEVKEQEIEEGEMVGHMRTKSEDLRYGIPVWVLVQDSTRDTYVVVENVASNHSTLPVSIIGTSPLVKVFSDVVAVDNSIQENGDFNIVGKRPFGRPAESGKSQVEPTSVKDSRLACLAKKVKNEGHILKHKGYLKP
ncbi:hypothetical protein NE237_020886 [Protea cynaroides]|uniref:Uncharacterized protein n=1 Tax=Protea cynaroides TaxID=273540 RepID=A0A9Q0K2R0_9MAGN|nr:hypothetical protein NE237_020886 [Protea cynaroides]